MEWLPATFHLPWLCGRKWRRDSSVFLLLARNNMLMLMSLASSQTECSWRSKRRTASYHVIDMLEAEVDRWDFILSMVSIPGCGRRQVDAFALIIRTFLSSEKIWHLLRFFVTKVGNNSMAIFFCFFERFLWLENMQRTKKCATRTCRSNKEAW